MKNDLLAPAIKALSRVLEDLFQEADLTTSVVLKKRGPTSWDPALGRNVTLEQHSEIPAVFLRHVGKEVREGGPGGYGRTDKVFLVRVHDVSTDISVNDAIVHQGLVHDVTEVEHMLGLVYKVRISAA
ncbi:MAG: hypothetical protein V2B18_02100 [Pseudomonadota bacterium]